MPSFLKFVSTVLKHVAPWRDHMYVPFFQLQMDTLSRLFCFDCQVQSNTYLQTHTQIFRSAYPSLHTYKHTFHSISKNIWCTLIPYPTTPRPSQETNRLISSLSNRKQNAGTNWAPVMLSSATLNYKASGC